MALNECAIYTCNRYLRRGKMPPCAFANNLKFPEVPTHLHQLFTSKWRMLSPRIAFMKMFEAAVGKQLKIHGNVVNVLAGVWTTLNTLPRIASESETIAIKFKRRSQFQHAFMTANIRPAFVRLLGKYLIENWQLFQKAQISFSDDINNSLSDAKDFNISTATVTTLSQHRDRFNCS